MRQRITTIGMRVRVCVCPCISGLNTRDHAAVCPCEAGLNKTDTQKYQTALVIRAERASCPLKDQNEYSVYLKRTLLVWDDCKVLRQKYVYIHLFVRNSSMED